MSTEQNRQYKKTVKFDGKKITNLNNESYYVVHQWDRTEFSQKIRDNFKNKISFVI